MFFLLLKFFMAYGMIAPMNSDPILTARLQQIQSQFAALQSPADHDRLVRQWLQEKNFLGVDYLLSCHASHFGERAHVLRMIFLEAATTCVYGKDSAAWDYLIHNPIAREQLKLDYPEALWGELVGYAACYRVLEAFKAILILEGQKTSPDFSSLLFYDEKYAGVFWSMKHYVSAENLESEEAQFLLFLINHNHIQSQDPKVREIMDIYSQILFPLDKPSIEALFILKEQRELKSNIPEPSFLETNVAKPNVNSNKI